GPRPAAAPAPARHRRAALLRGPVRGPDGRGARLLDRDRQDGQQAGGRPAPRPARRGGHAMRDDQGTAAVLSAVLRERVDGVVTPAPALPGSATLAGRR